LSWRVVLGIGATLALVGAIAAGAQLRDALGIELSVESVRGWLTGFGWRGPAIYVALVTCRPVLALPSWIVLSTGGLLFGPVLGTLLGAIGITTSGLVCFGISRSALASWILPRLGPKLVRLRERVESAGVWLVGLGTAHPSVPMTTLHLAGGLTTLSALTFALVLVPASVFRAGSFAVFGAMLEDPSRPSFFLASAFLLAVGVLPLAHPGLRRRLFGAS
jgi:uncharacterized membrane protein YdjX (TVP38/TMEM64 family)